VPAALWFLLAARADSTVLVTINGEFHNFDDTFSTTFSFDPALVFFYSEPYYYYDFLYPLLTPVNFPDPNYNLNTVDFFGSSLAFTRPWIATFRIIISRRLLSSDRHRQGF